MKVRREATNPETSLCQKGEPISGESDSLSPKFGFGIFRDDADFDDGGLICQ